MATITVSASQDGYLQGVGNTSFASARSSGGTAASAAANPTTSNANSIDFTKSAGGRGTSYFFKRSAFGFDVTSYSEDTITNAYLQIRTTTSGTNLGNTLYMVPFTGFGGTLGDGLVVGDWSNYTTGTSWGNESIANVASTQTLTLNSTGIAAFETGYVKIGLISNIDYLNIDTPAEEQYDDTWLNWGNSDNAKLVFDQVSAGYGNIVNGVAQENIGEVDGVATANISEVIGV